MNKYMYQKQKTIYQPQVTSEEERYLPATHTHTHTHM